MSEHAAWEWIRDWAEAQGDLGRAWAPRASSELAGLIARMPGLSATQPFRPDFRVLEAVAQGRLHAEPLSGPFDTVLFVPSRQRAESLGLLALGLERLAPAGRLVFVCANDLGAAGFLSRLRELVPGLEAESQRRCRLAVVEAAAIENRAPLQIWREAAAAGNVEGSAFRSVPGIYGWNKVDRGSELLVSTLPPLEGRGADLGAGYGYLSYEALRGSGARITELHAIEADARALACARENLRAHQQLHFYWLDVTTEKLPAEGACDWVLMNPPFHEGKQADPALGNAFIAAAARCLRPGGQLYMVANGFLPYEDALDRNFATHARVLATEGFKVIHARR
jgi:16S rRNA (guanine1207-N2)-methyltransferase